MKDINKQLANKRVGVLGGGETGLAVAGHLTKQGTSVFLSEKNSLEEEKREKLKKWGIAYEEGEHSNQLLDYDLLVLSPGVPLSNPVLQKAHKLDIPIVGEIELAYRLCKSDKIIAVTGTNGKTTTTHLIGEILRVNGYEVLVCGNIGNPFIGELDDITKDTIVVLEVSSYQLETIQKFRPWIAVLLNLAPDHLKRHGSVKNYYRIKHRIYGNQTGKDYLITSPDIDLPEGIKPQVIFYYQIEPSCVNAEGMKAHNLANLKAALAAGRIIDPSINLADMEIRKTLTLPHRIEFVAQIDRTKFYNDSKATNTHATKAAINSFSRPLTLILGGQDKGEDYSKLACLIKEKQILKVFLIGQAADLIARSLERTGYESYVYVNDFTQAIKLALRTGAEVCLMSPACASFDQFRNYKERGEQFKFAVTSLLK